MLPLLGAAVAIVVFEATAILMSTGMCVFNQSKLKRRNGKRFKGDLVYGNGYPRSVRENGVGAAGVIFASGGIGDGENGYRGNGGDSGPGAGSGVGGGTDGGDNGGDDGGGDGCDCGGGGCGGGCGGD
ncbi:hypothetical protein KC19_8G152900 [Ceratodon purpureus]|uniref:Uncharacterized protein n=1 Tax=Ceratodon purpureus TaxID=3225 RepID=A0A8T0GZ88_CERPU|nr:hypothetical protein KC19_8G152900 [Ceratodon purpureus]